jgi:hypothetical protein
VANASTRLGVPFCHAARSQRRSIKTRTCQLYSGNYCFGRLHHRTRAWPETYWREGIRARDEGRMGGTRCVRFILFLNRSMYSRFDHAWDLVVAWAVSLCADGKTYASTGASGAITVHSAEPLSPEIDGDTFGQRLAQIPTGRSKFGLYLDYNPVDSTRIAMSNETGQVRTPTTVK